MSDTITQASAIKDGAQADAVTPKGNHKVDSAQNVQDTLNTQDIHSQKASPKLIVEQMRALESSGSEKGWPVAVRDRLAYYAKEDKELISSSAAVTFLWTMRDAVLPILEKKNLALAANFYNPSGLAGMVRNIAANPFIRCVIMLGQESPGKDDTMGGATSANALRAFFQQRLTADRKVPGYEQSAYFDKNIPTGIITAIQEGVEFIDLNKKFQGMPLAQKIIEANKILESLRQDKEPLFNEPKTFPHEPVQDTSPYEGGPLTVRGRTIPKVWVEIMHRINKYGKKNLMNAKTDREVKEINNLVAIIHDPQNLDLSFNPFITPLTIEKIKAYQAEVLSPLLPEGKAYTYGNKLRAYTFNSPMKVKELRTTTAYKDFEFGQGPHIDANINYKGSYCEINQVQDIIDALKRDPYSKACVAITWHTEDELMRKHKSSPCLALMQVMVQDEKLNLTVYFRSHDMVNGWPENAYGCAAIQKEIADALNLPPGIITIISSSAQIYKTASKQIENMLEKYRTYSQREHQDSDPRGNYIINVKDKKIIVEHMHPETNSAIRTFEGETARELRQKIAHENEINTEHSIYLGECLAKAELCLQNGLQYVQDKQIDIQTKESAQQETNNTCGTDSCAC